MLFVYIFTGLCALGVVVSLVAGGLAMRSTAEDSALRSNKWMTRRVIFQALAILGLFAMMYLQSKK